MTDQEIAQEFQNHVADVSRRTGIDRFEYMNKVYEQLHAAKHAYDQPQG